MSENEDILIETTNTTNIESVYVVNLMNTGQNHVYDYAVDIHYNNGVVHREYFVCEYSARKFYEMVTGIKEKTYIITVDFEQIGYKLYNKSYDEIIETVKKEKGGDFRKITIEVSDD